MIPFYTMAGMLTPRVFFWGAIALPFSGVGILLGVRLFERVQEQVFYRLVIVLLALSGVHLLFS